MDKNTFFSRRTWLAASGMVSAVQLLGIETFMAKALIIKTPALTAEEIADTHSTH